MSQTKCARRSLAHFATTMGYRLPPTVRACRAEGDDLIFLDLERDRYLAAHGSAREALLERIVAPASAPHDALAALVAQKLLLFEPDRLDQLNLTERQASADAAEDFGTSAVRIRARDVIEVSWVRVRCGRRLRHQGIRAIQDSSLSSETDAPLRTVEALAEHLPRILRARALVPLAHTCLLDSLMLRTLLERRQLSSEIVVGVQAKPFKAHCWVEAGGCVLNDDPDMLRRFTPIYVA